jgi:hypothetical protein
MQAKVMHESTKLVPNLPKLFGVMASAGAILNRSKLYSIRENIHISLLY